MYLSRLTVDSSDRRAANWLRDIYNVHQRLLMAWPDGAVTPRNGRLPRMLFRIDWPISPAELTVILVQAPHAADWRRCFADLPILVGEPFQKPFDWRPQTGQILRFLLRANPTRRLAGGRSPGDQQRPVRGKRVDLRRDWEQLAWLDRHALGDQASVTGGLGFPNRRRYEVRDPASGRRQELDLPDIELRDLGVMHGRQRSGAAGPEGLTIRLVDFEGLLTVTDPTRFCETLRRGIGPAKAFGCGLLSVAPAG